MIPPKVTLHFQPYEVEIIQRALAALQQTIKGPWEQRPDGHWHHKPTAMNKRIKFVQGSIARQLDGLPQALERWWP